MSEELKPCPRCGGEMSVFQTDGYTWDVMCDSPDCIDEQVFVTREDAIAAANRRTPEPATAKVEDAYSDFVGRVEAFESGVTVTEQQEFDLYETVIERPISSWQIFAAGWNAARSGH